MLEFSANPAARAAAMRAHAERGRAVAAMWQWLFASKSSRG